MTPKDVMVITGTGFTFSLRASDMFFIFFVCLFVCYRNWRTCMFGTIISGQKGKGVLTYRNHAISFNSITFWFLSTDAISGSRTQGERICKTNLFKSFGNSAYAVSILKIHSSWMPSKGEQAFINDMLILKSVCVCGGGVSSIICVLGSRYFGMTIILLW